MNPRGRIINYSPTRPSLSPLPRKTVSLSDSQQQRLSVYAVAASAAGVGVMALSQPAEAKIVYTATHPVIENHGRRYERARR